MTELSISQLKKRAAILTVSFVIIAIPLIYTLHVSVSQVRLRNNIQFTLKQEFDVERRSHLDSFAFFERNDNRLEINAIINTVDYLKDVEIKRIEEKIARYLKRNIMMNVEQVRVQSGGLKEDAAKSPLLPTLAPSRPPREIIRISREDSVGTVRKSVEKIDNIIAPSVVEDFYIGFHYKTSPIAVSLKIKRDNLMSDSEILWLNRILSDDLGHPVDMKIETVPFVPPLVFNRGEKSLTEEMKKALLEIGKAYKRSPASAFVIESYPGAASQKEKRLAEERADIIMALFTEEFKIPQEKIKRIVHRGAKNSPMVKISVL